LPYAVTWDSCTHAVVDSPALATFLLPITASSLTNMPTRPSSSVTISIRNSRPTTRSLSLD
ncbi:hypothetical protein IWQ61_010684, partial [Dispira simplex]